MPPPYSLTKWASERRYQAITALRLLLRQPNIDRALVVLPASLGLNWQRELERWAPELVVRRLMGSQTERRAYYELPVAVLIATYEQVSVDALDRIPASAVQHRDT